MSIAKAIFENHTGSMVSLIVAVATHADFVRVTKLGIHNILWFSDDSGFKIHRALASVDIVEEDDEITDVIFRQWRNGDIIALFPNQDTGRYTCGSYMKVGQHSAADYEGVVSATILAAPKEYEDLKKELEKIGYKLRVLTRKPKK